MSRRALQRRGNDGPRSRDYADQSRLSVNCYRSSLYVLFWLETILLLGDRFETVHRSSRRGALPLTPSALLICKQVTRIYHPNVTDDGAICIGLLKVRPLVAQGYIRLAAEL